MELNGNFKCHLLREALHPLFQIKLEFRRVLFFMEGGKTENPEEKTSVQEREPNKRIPHLGSKTYLHF